MEIQNREKYPRMYVDPVTASKRQNWHFMNKFLPLSKALGKPAFIEAGRVIDITLRTRTSFEKAIQTDDFNNAVLCPPDECGN